MGYACDHRTAVIAVLLGSTVLSVPAFAQSSGPDQPQASTAAGQARTPPSPQTDTTNFPGASEGTQTAQGTEIVVTGSRIARPNAETTSPIVSLPASAFSQTGAVTLEDTLNRLPQFSPGTGSTTNDNLSGGITTLNLRGLGSNRTLVLLDGHRLPTATQLGAVDVNMVPQSLIQSVEVITGGASAAYGSDAIAGVVNFKIKHDFTGLQVDLNSGVSERGDGSTYQASVTAGTVFADNTGHIEASLIYDRRYGVSNADRPFSRIVRPSSNLPNGAYIADAGNLPSAASVNGVFAGYGVAPGSVSRSSNLGFNNDGSLFTYSGSNYNYQPGAPDIINNGRVRYNSSGNNGLILPIERVGGYLRAEKGIGDDTKVYIEGTYQHFTSSARYAPAGFTFDVPTTNPFIPANLAAILSSRTDPTADFTVARRFTDVGFRTASTRYDEFRILAGANGRLPIRDWKWDAYASYGQVRANETDRNGYSIDALTALIYASDGGRTLCTGGLNIFGTNAGSACSSYIRRDVTSLTRTTQKVLEGSIEGSLVHLPAGDVRFSAGGDYREDQFRFSPDAELQSGDLVSFSTGAIPPVRGTVSAKEVFAELLIPVIHDTFLIHKFEIGGGFRYSDYNTFGGVKTYRGEANWEAIRGVRLRGGYSRAVRAPSVGELYSPQTQASPLIGDPSSPGQGDPCDIRSSYRNGGNSAQVSQLCIAQGVPQAFINSYTFDNTQLVDGGVTGGNRNLRPESADTFTGGIVLEPHIAGPMFRNFSLSADYYNITVKNVIGTIDGLTVLQRCYNFGGFNPSYSASNVYCQLFGRSSTTGAINSISLNNQNLGQYKTSGIDFSVNWRIPIDGLGRERSSLNLNISATRLLDFKIQTFPGESSIQYSGFIGDIGYPKWRTVEHITYDYGPITINFQHRYIDAMTDASLVGTDDRSEHVRSINYFDLSFAIEVKKDTNFRIGVTNLTDVEPPSYSSFSQSNTNPGVYDVLGRAFYVGASIKF